MLDSHLKEAIRLGNVQRAQIEHLQSLQVRQTTTISPGEPAVPPLLGACGETTAEGQLAILPEHFNALLQVLPRRCLNMNRRVPYFVVVLITFHHVQVERAKSARLALELQQARQINVQLADLQQQQIGQPRQQSNALLQVLSRGT
jgi:hypothetical protein